MYNDLRAIEAVTWTYLNGLYEGDVTKLEHAFHPTSALTTAQEDGTIKIVPRDEWLEAVRHRPSPKAAGMVRGDHILTIDLVGPTLALVKVKCQMPPRYFTDYLVLMKLTDGWTIVSKSYRFDVRE